MEDKQIIEEMAEDLEPFITLHREVYVSANRKERHAWMLSEEDNKVIAEHLISKDWIKLPKDSIVLSREEYEELQVGKDFDYGYHEGCKNTEAYYENFKLPKECKETAEKIFAEIIWYSVKRIGKTTGDSYYQISYDRLNELARKINIKIKE